MYCRNQHQGHPASALLAVLTLSAVLGFSLFTTSLLLVQDLQMVGAMEGEFRARQLAGKALSIAAHPEVRPGDALLRWEGGIEGYEGKSLGEDRLPNLNRLLTVQERPFLEALFANWGLAASDASGLVDRLMDWVDPDDLPNLNGAESGEYADAGLAGFPLNRPFQSMAEVRHVMGIDLLDEVREGWEGELSVYASGILDVTGAAPAAIAAFTGCDLSRAQSFVAARAGRDGIADTPDDVLSGTVPQALGELGIPGDRWPSLQPRIGVQSLARRFVGRGWSGEEGWRIEVIASGGEAGGGQPTVHRVMERRER